MNIGFLEFSKSTRFCPIDFAKVDLSDINFLNDRGNQIRFSESQNLSSFWFIQLLISLFYVYKGTKGKIKKQNN